MKGIGLLLEVDVLDMPFYHFLPEIKVNRDEMSEDCVGTLKF